jgi:dTDP-4-amino-4,6-dideoxygalactose transaminase
MEAAILCRKPTMNIPFLDVAAAYAELKEEIDAAIHRVLDSGWFILGGEVEALESEFAAYTGAAHAVGVGNGLDALSLALRALDIGPGDEVLVPAHTFIATWLAVDAVGARCVPVDVRPDTCLIDMQQAEAALTNNTRAVIPVHLYGQPCDMAKIAKFAKSHELRVVEDAAQAHGAKDANQRIGTHGDAVCWSFYPGKNLGALGDGGAVTTDRKDVADRLQRLRNYGSDEKYVHREKGVNSRLDPMQAAILRVKLRVLDEWNARRRQLAARYSEALADTGLTLPVTRPGAEHVWHLYTVRTEQRDELMASLREQGVGCQIHYPIPPHLQDAYSKYRGLEGRFPVTEQIARTVLSLPMGPHLNDDQVEAVIKAVCNAVF